MNWLKIFSDYTFLIHKLPKKGNLPQVKKHCLKPLFFLTFSGTRGPATENTKKLIYYSLYSFGVPAIMTLMVLGLHIRDDSSDALNGNGNETISPMWRPGFGEETCWFTTCSHGIAYFNTNVKKKQRQILAKKGCFRPKIEVKYKLRAKWSQYILQSPICAALTNFYDPSSKNVATAEKGVR